MTEIEILASEIRALKSNIRELTKLVRIVASVVEPPKSAKPVQWVDCAEWCKLFNKTPNQWKYKLKQYKEDSTIVRRKGNKHYKMNILSPDYE